MTDQMSDTWFSRELPVLRYVVEAIDENPGRPIGINEISLAVFLDDQDFGHKNVLRALHALARDNFVVLEPEHVLSGATIEQVANVSAEAQRIVGMWPTPESVADRLVSALEQIAANTTDEDTKNRAQTIRDLLIGAGRDIAVGVGMAMITGAAQ